MSSKILRSIEFPDPSTMLHLSGPQSPGFDSVTSLSTQPIVQVGSQTK